MVVLHINVRVKPDMVEAFKQATIANARYSIKEPGIARFELIQHEDDPARFLLAETYRSVEATAAHKATTHYAVWRDAVELMMAEERTRVRYANIFPSDEGW